MTPALRVVPNAAVRATSLLRTIQFTHPPSCPCHSNPGHHHNHVSPSFSPRPLRTARSASPRAYASHAEPLKEYAFEIAASSLRFGPGATQEVGLDLANFGPGTRVAVVTDGTVDKLRAMSTVRESLDREGIDYTVFSAVRSEPKEASVRQAIDWMRTTKPDVILAVGGGSVMDTAKLANLYTCYPDAELLDFVNAPLGKGMAVDKTLLPLICIPTTAGTGSETTGTAIFDINQRKTGISDRKLKSHLAIIDPLNMDTMSPAIRAAGGLDSLTHALESITAIPYNERTPRPTNPLNRPAYQGRNPISDLFAWNALRSTVKYLPRSVRDPEDTEASHEMGFGASIAGFGFASAGVHLCHGMSYGISSNNPTGYRHAGYDVDHPLIPHGVSVAVTAPAVFRFTAASNPERHLQAAEAFGVDISRVRKEDAGEVLADALTKFLAELGDQPAGIKDLGFGSEHIEQLVESTLPQKRVLQLAPGLDPEVERSRDQLRRLFEKSMTH